VLGSLTMEQGTAADRQLSSLGVPHTSVLVTLPVHNEENLLRNSVDRVTAVLNAAGIDFTLAIAEDGSTDGTRDLIQQIAKEYPRIVVQTRPERHGRGWALRTLWSKIDAEYYAFSDADFAADPQYLVSAIRSAQQGNPIVVGSRYVPGSRVSRPPLRRMTSEAYNRLVRLLFSENVRDHQCGLKVFSRDAVRRLLPLTHENSWFWDTEVLVLANDVHLGVTEVPVNWVEHKTRRTEFRRLLSDFYLHGTGLLRLAGERQPNHPTAVPISVAPRAGWPRGPPIDDLSR
jgi:glycosyltransferase AglD